jgi:hypothetical protein
MSVLGSFFRQEFQRRRPVQAGVLCFVDNTHTAAKLFNNPVVRDGLPDERQTIAIFSATIARL